MRAKVSRWPRKALPGREIDEDVVAEAVCGESIVPVVGLMVGNARPQDVSFDVLQVPSGEAERSLELRRWGPSSPRDEMQSPFMSMAVSPEGRRRKASGARA